MKFNDFKIIMILIVLFAVFNGCESTDENGVVTDEDGNIIDTSIQGNGYLVGTNWRITETINGQNCREGDTVDIYNMSITNQIRHNIYMYLPGVNQRISGTYIGNKINMSGISGEDREGYLKNTRVRATVNSVCTSMQGNVTWDWYVEKDDLEKLCSGTSTFQAARTDGAGCPEEPESNKE